MELYIVIIQDRHTDTVARPFTDPDVAIQHAKEIAQDRSSHVGDYEEHDYGRDVGWLFFAQYSCEGDHTRVVTAELDKEY